MTPPKGRKARSKAAPRAAAPVISLATYTVDMAASAKAVYAELYNNCKEAEERGDPSNYNCTLFHMVRDAIKNIIPADPINKRYALSGDLSNIFRLKKGRLRICWVASSEHRRLCILFISDTLRKDGDVNDPYRIFTQIVMAGKFNDVFGALGVRIPPRTLVPTKLQ
jgi:mRNA-degrading endonuclease RelE of RelBE toxin-antitoxin system